MVLVAFFAVLFVAPVASAVVYVDAAHRDLLQRERLLWTLAVGAVSFCGFLLPHLFEKELNWMYLVGIKSAPVVSSPREILALHLTVGMAISVASVLLYGLGIRDSTLR